MPLPLAAERERRTQQQGLDRLSAVYGYCSRLRGASPARLCVHKRSEHLYTPHRDLARHGAVPPRATAAPLGGADAAHDATHDAATTATTTATTAVIITAVAAVASAALTTALPLTGPPTLATTTATDLHRVPSLAGGISPSPQEPNV